MRRVLGIILLAGLLLPVIIRTPQANAQNLPPVNPGEVQGNITIRGAEVLVPLTQSIANLFSTQGYAGNLTVTQATTANAITDLCNGAADMALAARQISAEEVNACSAVPQTPVGFRVANDAIVVVASPQNTFINDLSSQEVQTLFSTAVNWSDVRTEFPTQPIQRYGPSTESGAFRFFASAVYGGDERPLRTALGSQYSDNLEGLAQNVSNNQFAVGFFPSSFLNQTSVSVQRLSIGGIAPTSDSIVNATYPLTQPLFLYSTEQRMQTATQVASFINFYLSNLRQEISSQRIFPASPQALEQAAATWFRVTGGSDGGDTPPVPTATPPVPAIQGTPEGFASPTPQPTIPAIGGEATAQPTQAVALFQEGVLPLLADARSDLETLATAIIGSSQRPDGWNGTLAIDNPQLPVLIRLDLEILAAIRYGQNNRPDEWFGAVSSTQAAIARDIRHDLEVIAQDHYGSVAEYPRSWTDVDPILRCDRSTQNLIEIAALLGYTVPIDRTSPNYCQQATLAVSRYSEVNILAPDVRVSAGGGGGGGIRGLQLGDANIPGNVTIDSRFAVGFLDRNANRKLGTIPLESPIEPVARSYTQFSNMTLVRGNGFLVFVDWLDTTLTAQQFMALPDVNTIDQEPFCDALWC